MNSFTGLCQVPAAPSPNGHHNFVNPTSLAPALMGVMSVMVASDIIFTAARFYVNTRVLGLDDSILGIEGTLADRIVFVKRAQSGASYLGRTSMLL
ncbi:predicted protein [Sclerotinia sclerotiorum 1980 UF-70]|uniref:Uncharacterized protein n=1 Tax=Sclerotinia sclerotiorum (strain ATCC 18683 / 1980 / Ss-1) TaxID=665079 RepID=A7F3G0_SCLS1|nr:predicted protein [Sclerotinia sclerotiorum 1980 UF-70]EDN97281.1 predicted protein [Sclerotinia sclerotiorum 1980 UF-70]